MNKRYLIIIAAFFTVLLSYFFFTWVSPPLSEDHPNQTVTETPKKKNIAKDKELSKTDTATSNSSSTSQKTAKLQSPTVPEVVKSKSNPAQNRQPGADGLLELITSSSDPSEMFKAIREQGFFSDESIQQELLDCWMEINKHPDDPLLNERHKALLVGFVLSQTEEALPLANDLFNDTSADPKTKMYALQAIASLGGNPQLEFAMQYTNSDDPTMKTRAIEALGLIGDTAAIPELERIATEEQLVFRRAAKVSLLQIEANGLTGSDKVTYIHDQLKKNEQNVPLAIWGVHTLWVMNTPEAIDTLKSLADPGQNTTRFLNTLSTKALNNR